MLVAVSTAQVVSWGILYYAFSVFVAPMQAELGWPLCRWGAGSIGAVRVRL